MKIPLRKQKSWRGIECHPKVTQDKMLYLCYFFNIRKIPTVSTSLDFFLTTSKSILQNKYIHVASKLPATPINLSCILPPYNILLQNVTSSFLSSVLSYLALKQSQYIPKIHYIHVKVYRITDPNLVNSCKIYTKSYFYYISYV